MLVGVVKSSAGVSWGGGVTRRCSLPSHFWRRIPRCFLQRCEGLARGGGRGRKWLMGVVLSGTLVGYHRCLGQLTSVVFCKEHRGSRPPSSRLPTSSQNSLQGDQAFNWTLFAKYIWPDLFFFMVAVGVGILNSLNAVYLFYGPTILNVYILL